MKPTVGRIVHFYNEAYADHDNNSVGKGPYAAVVAQVFPDDPYANLEVIIPFGENRSEGSVSEGAAGSGRYWCWPPIGSPSGPS